ADHRLVWSARSGTGHRFVWSARANDWSRPPYRKFSDSRIRIVANRTMRILVVEDERRMAELLRQGLAEDGHSVVVATRGREALNIAENGAFDLILLDVMLPEIDGFTIARRLRAG